MSPRKLRESSLVTRFRQDFEFRTVVMALVSSFTTACIGGYFLALAILIPGGKVWTGTLAGYSFSLAFARVALLLSHRIGLRRGESGAVRQRRDTWNYLACGVLLVLLSLAFSGVVVLTATRGFHREYGGHLIYAAAFYAFWKTAWAIRNLVKARRNGRGTVQAFRNIGIADALVSIASLQAAMLAAFPSENLSVGPFNAATGGIAGALILALGLYMIVRGSKRLLAPPEEEE